MDSFELDIVVIGMEAILNIVIEVAVLTNSMVELELVVYKIMVDLLVYKVTVDVMVEIVVY